MVVFPSLLYSTFTGTVTVTFTAFVFVAVGAAVAVESLMVVFSPARDRAGRVLPDASDNA